MRAIGNWHMLPESCAEAAKLPSQRAYYSNLEVRGRGGGDQRLHRDVFSYERCLEKLEEKKIKRTGNTPSNFIMR